MNRCATTSSFREMNEVILQFSFSDCVFSMSSLKTNQNKIKSNLATRFWRGLCGLYREQSKDIAVGIRRDSTARSGCLHGLAEHD